jgi:hypothetical protein
MNGLIMLPLQTATAIRKVIAASIAPMRGLILAEKRQQQHQQQ